MANTISTPSWREDQPWSIEQGLANSLGARSPNLAETMLTRYGIERQQNQADYHDYMRAINALQAQNLADTRHDADAKLGLEAVKLGGTYQGAGRALATNSVTSPYYTGDTTLLDQGAMDNAAAKQIHDAGLGLGGAAAAGQTPESLANTANNVPAMRGSQFTVPSNVQAQAEANKGRIGAALIGAEGRDQPTVHSSTPATATTQGVGVSGKQRRGETLQQTNERLLQGQAVRTPGQHAMSQMVDNATPPPQLPLAQTDGGPMDRTPNGSTPAGPRGVGPTADQATKAVTAKMVEWLAKGDPVHQQIVREASQYSTDQGQGGKFIVRTDGGRLYVLGRGGQAYLVQ